MRLLIKSVNLLGLLLSVAWLSREMNMVSAVTTLGLLATLIGQEAREVRVKLSVEKDRDLYEKFLQQLPSNGRSVFFLKEQDIGASFRKELIREISDFRTYWDNAEHEFNNKKLEKLRGDFLLKTKEFLEELSVNIFSEDKEFFAMDIDDVGASSEKWQERDKLNNAATELYKLHQDIVRTGKKVL